MATIAPLVLTLMLMIVAMSTSIQILQTEESHYLGQYRAFAQVAAEKSYLATLEAPPFEVSLAFFRSVRARGFPQRVALDSETVVGWCDIAPLVGQSRVHAGVLGMGLLPLYRHIGLGARLMEAALDAAWHVGLTRVELTVRADNLNAQQLYRRFGFELEGVQRRANLVDGVYRDLHCMAVLR